MAKERDDKLERLTSTIQRKLDGNPALMIGCGGSIPHGLPSMEELSKGIKNSLQGKYKNDETWKSFILELDKNNNLELSLENITLNKEIHNDLMWAVWFLVKQKDISALNNLLYTDTFPALTHILRKFIQQAGSTNIVTTNYDRLIEYAIDYAEGQSNTGFSNNYVNKFTQFASNTNKRVVNLYKVHGSIDWFKHKENEKLLSLRFFDKSKLVEKFDSQIVTPGNSKFKETYLEPFRTVISKADEALRKSCAYLCIGYGFNDEHIQPIIIDENRNKKKPIVIVTKNITPKIKELFFKENVENCLIISENNSGGSVVNYSYNKKVDFIESYWQLENFYKLWFE